MKMSHLSIMVLGIVALGFALSTLLQTERGALPSGTVSDEAKIQAVVSYQCNEEKTIRATYYDGDTTPSARPDMPPVPGGGALIMLSDGRAFNLHQTISASGIRYSNGDPFTDGSETVVFWSKGDMAFILENDVETYSACIQTALES